MQTRLLLIAVCVIMTLQSCKKAEVKKIADTPDSQPTRIDDRFSVKEYIGTYSVIDECYQGEMQTHKTETPDTLWLRKTADNRLYAHMRAPGCRDYEADTVEYVPSQYDSMKYDMANKVHHHSGSCVLAGDSVQVRHGVFHCVTGSNCEVWNVYYKFDGVLAKKSPVAKGHD